MASQKDTRQPEPNSTSPDWAPFGDRGDRICRRCLYMNYCKCMWCGQCGQHTTATYGHWTTICRMSRCIPGQMTLSETMGQGHFCCPGQCELEEDKVA